MFYFKYRSPTKSCVGMWQSKNKQAEQLRQSSAAYRYLLFNVRLAVGNELLMLTLTEPFFCVLRTTDITEGHLLCSILATAVILKIQILCRPSVVLVLGGRKSVVANECPKYIMPERLMLIAIAVVDLEGFEILAENALGTWLETGTVLNLFEV